MNGPSATDRRIALLTTGPVLRTLAGTRARLAAPDWPDLQGLCRHFGTDISGLEICLWTGRRKSSIKNHPSSKGKGELS